MLIALLIIAVSGRIVRGHHMFMVGFDLDTRPYLTFLVIIEIINISWFLFHYRHCIKI